jgi:hypothetical protein
VAVALLGHAIQQKSAVKEDARFEVGWVFWHSALSLLEVLLQSRQTNLPVNVTSVCFRSMRAKGLNSGVWLEVSPFVSLTGLSGGGVASCGMGLKWLRSVRARFQLSII